MAQHPARRALQKLWAPVPWMLEAAIVLQPPVADAPALVTFLPFDQQSKRSEAAVRMADGMAWRVVKGAPVVVASMATARDGDLAALEGKGYRVLAVAAGRAGALQLAGLIALSDPPRADSAALVAELAKLRRGQRMPRPDLRRPRSGHSGETGLGVFRT